MNGVAAQTQLPTSPASGADQGIVARFLLQRTGFQLDVDLQLPTRGITALHGPSGSGKSTLLRCVAGLERGAAIAQLTLPGQIWHDSKRGIFVPPHRRALGYVFQEASLFPHLSVQANLHYGLKRTPATERRIALEQAIDLLGIAPLLARRPAGLSGGERQRVAIARALAASPRLLLLDEPLASLDAARKQEILPWLERLRDELAIPMLYVSHAADEVARLAHTLVVLQDGRALACGPVAETLARLDLPIALGEDAGVLIEARVSERDERWHLCCVRFDGGQLWVRDSGAALGQAARVRVLARDISIATVEPQGTSINNLLPCVVEAIADDPQPAQALVRLRAGPTALLARLTRRSVHALALAPGQPVWAQVKAAALVG